MALPGVLSKLHARVSEPPLTYRVDDVRDSTASPRADLVPEQSYVHVRLAQLHLRYAREWWNEYVPLATATVQLGSSATDRAMPCIVGPSKVGDSYRTDEDPIDVTGVSVVGPVVYLGSGMRLVATLHRVKRADWAKRCFELLETVAQHVDPSRVTSALALAPSLLDSVERVLGMDDVQVKIGADRSMELGGAESGDNALRPGWLAIFAGRNAPARGQLLVRHDQLWLNGRDGPAPLTAADFMLFQIRALDQREDYATLGFARQQWPRVTDLIWQFQPDAARAAFQRFAAALFDCADLTRTQRRNLYTSYEQRYADETRQAELVASGAAWLDAAPRPDAPTEADLATAALADAAARPDLDQLLAAYA